MELAEEKKAMKDYGSADSGASLGDILGAALEAKSDKKKDNDASKKKEDIQKTFSLLNSSLSKAVKKGIIKKKHVSRKLSSFSKLINK